MPTSIQRFFAKIEIATNGCWNWTAGTRGRITPAGSYGAFSDGGKDFLAHRWAYETLVGPIPEGLEIDHACNNTMCVNPTHLRPATHWENVMRGNAPAAWQFAQVACKYGHAFTPENTYVRPDGKRECLACRRSRRKVA